MPSAKKWDNLQAALALHFCHYNFCRIHGSLRITPAMAAGITNRVWEIEESHLLSMTPLPATTHACSKSSIFKSARCVMTLRFVAMLSALAAVAEGQPRPPGPIPVIVELFTSE